MKTLLTLLAVACSYVLMAQGNAKISGTVNDSTSNMPVEFATVALIDASGKTIDGAICDDKGEFTINKVEDGNYKLSITFIGFDPKTVAVRVGDKRNVDIGTITISPTSQVLKEVTIEGQRALIEERVDRTIYNAENDATARGGDATDVLKRVPLLSVDMDGNVSLRGNQNITVLINNKPSTIVASSVADALKQIPADEIKTVEVITSPSAKYDAEGSAGIINIVTKKNNLQGLTLNINSGFGYRGSNLGLNGNYRKGKMGFSLGGFGRSNYNVTGSFNNEQIIKNIDLVTGERLGDDMTTIQKADTRNQGLFGRYNFGWDYDIDKKNFLAASVRFGIRNGENKQDDLQQYRNGTLQSLRDIISNDESNNIDASFTYTHLYTKPQHELSFQGLYSRNNGDNVFENFNRNLADFSISDRFKNLNESLNEEMTIQVDYQAPIGTTQMIELGGKNITRKAVSDFTSYNADGADGAYVASVGSALSNNLNYDQNVTAGYFSYTLSTKAGYSLKAGTRYEHTTINAYTESDDNITIPSYGIFVPSINVSKKLKGGNMVKASYNRRIQRPSIRFLNPNIQQSNPLNVTVGNPELAPEYTNNYELSYSTFVKGTMINISGFARNTDDAIQSVRDVIGNVRSESDPDTIRTRYQNIGSENAYGASIFANVTLGKLSLNGGGDFYYAVLSNNNDYWAYQASNEGWVASGRVFGSYELTKGWGFQFFSFVRGRQVQLQGTQSGFYMYSFAVKKDINEKRGSIGVGVENFFQKSIKFKNIIESPLLVQNSLNTRNNFSFRVNFSYRIGKMSMEDRPRRRRSINNDDLKEGGDGNGDGGMGGGGLEGGATPQRGGNAQMPVNRGAQGPQTRQPTTQATTANSADSITYEAAGTWTYTIDSPQGGGGTIVLKKENDVYLGTIKTDRMPAETALTSVIVKGNEVSISYTVSFGGNTVPVEIRTTINGADMQGTMALGQFRTFNLTGKKSQ